MCQSVPQPSTTTIKKIVFDDSSPKASVTKENRSPVFAQRFSPCQTRVRRRGPGNGHSRQTLKPAALRRIVLTLLIEQPSCWTMLFEQILFCMVNCLGYYIAGWYIQWLQTPGSGSIASNPLGGCFFFLSRSHWGVLLVGCGDGFFHLNAIVSAESLFVHLCQDRHLHQNSK